MVRRSLPLALCLVLRCGAQGNDPCDPGLLKLARIQHPDRYGPRGGRCEGVYEPTRSAEPALTLVSYTTALGAFDPQRDRSVRLAWRNPRPSPVHLRCYSLLRDAQYVYQMDAVPSAEPPAFDWRMDVLRELNLPQDVLTLVGWTQVATPRGVKDLYLPLEVTRGQPSGKPAPVLVVLPGYDLARVRLTVEKLNPADFTTVAVLVDHAELKDVSTSAKVPIRLEERHLKLAGSGYYCVTLSADVGGSPKAPPMYLYYAE